MNIVPAIDVRDGHCVQLLGGSYDHELVRIGDPAGVAARWRDLGFTRLHLVDLDAATGRGHNTAIIEAICALEGIDVDAGGGVREDADVARLLDAGATSVLVGTRAVNDPTWLAEVVANHPEQLSLAVDVRRGSVTTEGWTASTSRDPLEIVAAVQALQLAQVIVTSVDVEGGLRGPDLALVDNAREATTHRLGVAGGVSSRSDLAALRARGVDAAIVGTALYTGALPAQGLVEEGQS